MASSTELIRYQTVLRDRQHSSGPDETKTFDPTLEELRMAALVWWEVKQHFESQPQVERGYAVLGHVPEDDVSIPDSVTRTPVFLNTDSRGLPSSAVLKVPENRILCPVCSRTVF